MNTTIKKTAALAVLQLITTFKICQGTNANLLNAINELTQTNSIFASTATISSSLLSQLTAATATDTHALQSLGSNTQATLCKIPPALLQASQLLYFLVSNTNLSTQSDLNATALNVIALVNALDTIALQWSLVSYLKNVDTTTHTALSGFATGTTGSWAYTTNTATTGWLQNMSTKITAYIAKLVQLKSLSSFILSGTLKDITTLQGSLWVVDQQNNAIVELSSDGTVLSTNAITTSSSGAQNITGSGSTLWFIEQTSRKIGKLTTSGTLTELSLGNQVTLTDVV